MCPNISIQVYTGPTRKAFAKSFGAPALITHECKVLSGWWTPEWTRNPGHCMIFLHMCPTMQSRASNRYSSPASSDLIRIDMEPRRSSLLEPAELIKMPTFQPTPWRQAKHVLSRQETCVNWAAARPVYTSDIPGQTSKLLLTSSLLRKTNHRGGASVNDETVHFQFQLRLQHGDLVLAVNQLLLCSCNLSLQLLHLLLQRLHLSPQRDQLCFLG